MSKHALPFSRTQSKRERPRSKKYPKALITIADHLRKRRLELHLFQSEVAIRIGVSTDTITYWENGRAIPQIQHMPRIITFLGYNPTSVDKENLAGKIKEYRSTHELSYKAIGKLLGVHASTVGSWEKERFKPNRRIENKLTRLLSKPNVTSALYIS